QVVAMLQPLRASGQGRRVCVPAMVAGDTSRPQAHGTSRRLTRLRTCRILAAPVTPFPGMPMSQAVTRHVRHRPGRLAAAALTLVLPLACAPATAPPAPAADRIPALEARLARDSSDVGAL